MVRIVIFTMNALHRSRAVVATMATLAAEGAAIVALTAIGREPAFRIPLAHLDDWLAATPSTIRRTGGSAAQRTARTAVGTRVTATTT